MTASTQEAHDALVQDGRTIKTHPMGLMVRLKPHHDLLATEVERLGWGIDAIDYTGDEVQIVIIPNRQ